MRTGLRRAGLVVVCVGLVACGRPSAERHFARGDAHFQAEEYDRAVEEYKAGLAQNPASAPAWNRLGMTYRLLYNESRTSNWKKLELEAFEHAVASDSTYWPALVNLGATLYYLGQKEEAAGYIRKSLALHPENPDRPALEALLADTSHAD
jgi:tetratricopeptide (TPR) repeat protein